MARVGRYFRPHLFLTHELSRRSRLLHQPSSHQTLRPRFSLRLISRFPQAVSRKLHRNPDCGCRRHLNSRAFGGSRSRQWNSCPGDTNASSVVHSSWQGAKLRIAVRKYRLVKRETGSTSQAKSTLVFDSAAAMFELELRGSIQLQCIDEPRHRVLQRLRERIGRVENEHAAAIQSKTIRGRVADR